MADTEMKSKIGIRAIAFKAARGLFAALLFITAALGQRRERLIDTWKPLHYDVAITLNDQLTEIAKARTEINVEVLAPGLTRIDLDCVEMPVDPVSVSGQLARFERSPEMLNITLARAAQTGDKLSIVVNYHGRPKDGLIFASDRDSRASATGDNWPNRVHQWIPCLDHPSAKATVSFFVAAPPRELVVANGKFGTMTRNGNATSLWQFDETKAIPAYCLVIAVTQGANIDSYDQT